ncbi:MAG: prephenate dehydratase [Deltaproteobacteria bacterium]|jgi:chorismate mutase/prephenate dehydratase|nr:prephenate dehydratase [Deltaproteobacteria bacterium]
MRSHSHPQPAGTTEDAARLGGIRREIDAIDAALLDLLNRRAGCSLEAGGLKAGKGSPVFRPGREEELVQALLDRNPGPLPDAHLRAVYREILSSSRALQRPLKVAYLGPEGTFSHMAAVEFFGHSMDFLPLPRFDDIFEAVANRNSDIGVVPLENSLHGTIVQSIDLFAAHSVHIQAEWFSRISHSLMSRERDIGAITTVYSHPQALGQCANWLRAHLPEARLLSVDSTAAAAHKALGEAGAAAIGHGSLASRLGLSLLAKGIEDTGNNWTRFVSIGAEAPENNGPSKTSALFTLPDKPGTLAAVLQCFASAKVNMNKLESRPMRSERWKYIFFCDIACNLMDAEHAALLEKLRGRCLSFRILGAYPAGRYMETDAG